jgi:polysaccharide deacetylase family protein (PEP-CTERM system associated)
MVWCGDALALLTPNMPVSSVSRAMPSEASLRSAYARPDGGVVNALSVDVEDYFQVSAFDGHVARERWDGLESRVCRNTERLLEIFDEASVRATFFVLGWVAERHPSLVRAIALAGHEIASHGYGHGLVYDMTPGQFREDVRRAKALLESLSGMPVLGYRAPSYSITRDSLWALDVLASEGHMYDASIFPIHHDRYGIPDAPRHAHARSVAHGTIWEFPGSTVRVAGQNLPIGGGGYFRLLPYGWTRRGIERVNRVEARPVMFYLHPWEIDPEQPRIAASVLSRFRHYRNLEKTEGRLRRLLRDFAFAPAFDVLSTATAIRGVAPAGIAAPAAAF